MKTLLASSIVETIVSCKLKIKSSGLITLYLLFKEQRGIIKIKTLKSVACLLLHVGNKAGVFKI